MHWKGEILLSQVDRAGHEGPGEDCGWPHQTVSVNDSQFAFVLGRGTTDAIFVVRQLQEKYLAANKRLYMAFLDLEKVFECSGGRCENLVWRSGLCDCRRCMPICGAVYMLVRETVKSLK